MMHTLLYNEMNQAVPGGASSLSPGHEGSGGYGSSECQTVPSPSQWSDPCYSPPSFHSPQHLPVELEKVKEEPYSPSSSSSPASYLSLPASPPTHSPPSSVPTHPSHSPYGRPSPNGVMHVLKKDSYESCINLSDLLNENQNLVQQHQQQHPASASPPYVGYPDHPLLRGRLEDANAFQKKMTPGSPNSNPPPQHQTSFDGSYLLPHHLEEQNPPNFQQKMSPASSNGSLSPAGGYKDTDEGLSFLESLVDVKREMEDDVSVGSSCGSPAVPSPGGVAAGQHVPSPDVGSSPTQVGQCQRDILETVEILAQEHNRRDVQRVSDSLNIPIDPAQWSVEDVRAWLKLQASQLNLPPLMLDFWNYGGPSLLKLTEQQFRQLAPIGGELLYAKLEIWREALRASPKLSPSSSPSPMDQQRHAYASFLQHRQQVVMGHQEQNNLMLLAPHHAAAAQLQHHLQQQQQVVHPSGGSSQGVSSPLGVSSMVSSAPPSPPMPLLTSLSQVPAPVAQVSQQQQANNSGSPSPPSPPQHQQQGTTSASAVYLEEPCLDMSTLLHQSPTGGSPKGSSSSHHPQQTHCSPSSQDDASYDSDDEVEEETCSTGGSGRGGTHIHLWQFLKELLQQPQLYGSCIRWLDRPKGVFKIEDSVRVARLWGKRKNRPAMNYDKLSRSIRQYYKKGIMKKTERSQRLVYQFCHPYCL